jgi:hypothetical protein
MLKRLLFGFLLVSGAATALPPDARAQEVCADRDAIVTKLNNDLGEVRVDGAAASPTAFYEFFASESTRTWTILLSGVNGVSCVVAVGQDWRRPIETTADMRGGWPRPGALSVR